MKRRKDFLRKFIPQKKNFKGEIISKKQISWKKQISEKISKKFVEETNFTKKFKEKISWKKQITKEKLF
jgi:hypothetical protein